MILTLASLSCIVPPHIDPEPDESSASSWTPPKLDECTARLMSPDQVATVLEDLTGFVWEYDNCGQLSDDLEGYRVLAGGADGEKVRRHQQAASLTWALSMKRAAEGAALKVVAEEMLIGAGLDGGRVVGAMDDNFLGRMVDLNSGELSESGVGLEPPHIGATVMALADIGYADLLPRAHEPLWGILT